MILNLLTKGWGMRGVISLIWLLLIVGRYIMYREGDETADNFFSLLIFIGLGSVIFYSVISRRLMLLIQNDMSKVIPDYFRQLKQALLLLLGISFVPTILMLPNITAWLALMTIILMLAVTIVAIAFQPKLSIVALFLWGYSPWYWLTKVFDMPNIESSLLKIYMLPFVAIGTYWLLNKLEYFKRDSRTAHKTKVILSTQKDSMLTPSHKLPLKLQNRFVRWVSNNNFDVLRKLIYSEEKMTNKQRLAIACQGDYSVGRTTYLLWFLVAALLSWVGNYVEGKPQELQIIFVIMIATMIVGTGSISFFQTITSKSEMLKRLSMAPCFDNKKTFSSAFLHYVLEQQLKLYLFISMIIAMFIYTQGYFTWTLLINSLLITLMAILFNLAVILWSWSSNERIDTLAVWLMLSHFVCSVVLLLIVAESNTLLWSNTTFIIFVMMLVGGISINLLRSHRTIPSYI
ncbi:MAG: hypothetical protein ACPGR2_11615 [Psychrobium sp.]